MKDFGDLRWEELFALPWDEDLHWQVVFAIEREITWNGNPSGEFDSIDRDCACALFDAFELATGPVMEMLRKCEDAVDLWEDARYYSLHSGHNTGDWVKEVIDRMDLVETKFHTVEEIEAMEVKS